MGERNEQDGFIVEYYAVGHQVKATAVDPASGLEASVIGPTSATRQELAQLAVRKLNYLLTREQKENE